LGSDDDLASRGSVDWDVNAYAAALPDNIALKQQDRPRPQQQRPFVVTFLRKIFFC
jgi:predicted helicase